jgi:very-short-patch-repair endonuclease
MCIENSTIGFIENSFQGLVDMKRQQKFDKYRVDLYFPAYKLIFECDERQEC